MLPSLPLACHASALLMSYAPENGVPSRTLSSNLEFRTLPLFALSYGDENNKSLAGLFQQPQTRHFQNLERTYPANEARLVNDDSPRQEIAARSRGL